MNTFICKGYVHKSDPKPLIQHKCEAMSLNQAKTQFRAHLSEQRVRVNVHIIRPVSEETTKPATDLPVNSATGTTNPY